MKYNLTILIFLLSMMALHLTADDGDTIVIQTIDWDTPVLPGWNSPRSGIYQFPGDTITFSKILMYYTLKCDPAQNPACGEWDYTTHTKILVHTGIYDSNLYYHTNYLVNDGSPDTFMFMNDTSYSYKAMLEYLNQTTATNTATLGEGGSSINFPRGNLLKDGKEQFIYKADELSTSGLNSGNLTGLKLNINSGSLHFKHFQVRMQSVDINSLPDDSLLMQGFETVFNRNIDFQPGENDVDFSFPFYWEGSQNILVEFSWSGYSGQADMEADQIDSTASVESANTDFFLDFEGWDYITVPKEVFSDIDSAITISFWQYGNPSIQPANESILEGVDSAGHRILNIHLPWGNGRIYWDAGWENGYDRLDRTATAPSDYKGKWNYWTFTKDIQTGIMKVYLNGDLWNIGGGNYRTMSGISQFRIGAAISYDGYYSGMIDEVRIWNKEINAETIKEWMYKPLDPSHPDYSHLMAWYRFDDGGGFMVKDSSPNNDDGTQFGYPAWKNYRGTGRFKNAVYTGLRPNLTLENGNYDPSLLDSLVVVDTFAKAPVNIVLFDSLNPPVPLDTLTKWPSYYNNYVFDDNAQATDSTLVSPDSVLYHDDWPYYGTPYEIINPWEIGRFITPYGNGLSLGDGFTWVFDVTDYEPFLHDSVHLTAGNFQELLNLKFYMIEGIPPRDVLKIEKVYSGYYNLKDFSTLVPPDTIALIPEASTFKIKTRTSGHLFDNPTNCAEFCPKIHDLKVNNETVYSWQILQECSDNPLYPQGGTWIYDRAAWCPGMKVTEQDIEISPYINNDTVVVDYNSQYDPYGAYSLEVQLFSYGEPNFSLDAAIDEVPVPNNAKRYGRLNPTASAPVIILCNRGADTLRSVTITFGPSGTQKTVQWTGNLAFMEKEEVHLEAFNREEWENGNGIFNVQLSDPNNKTDNNPVNVAYSTHYNLTDLLPVTFAIHFKTNKAAYQNSYEILTNNGQQVFAKDGFDPETLYVDTVTFFNGCYDFYLYDSGNNGISFWAEPGEGNGYIKFYDMNGELIRNFISDFGDQVHYGFCTDASVGINENVNNNLTFDILPNPNSGIFTVSYLAKDEVPMSLKIYNTSGQNIWGQNINPSRHGTVKVDLREQPSGIYTIRMENKEKLTNKKFVIMH